MKILFTRFPLESRYGGAEVQTLTLMKGLQERGHEVSFLGSCPVLLKETEKINVRCEKLNIGPPPVTKWGVVSFAWRQWGMRRRLIEGIQQHVTLRRPVPALCHPEEPRVPFDRVGPCWDKLRETRGASRRTGAGRFEGLPKGDVVVFMLSLSEKLLLTQWAHDQGIAVVWIEHDRVGRWLTLNPWLLCLRRSSRLATTVVVSDLSRENYLKLGLPSDRVVTISNGMDLEKFTPNERETRNEKRETLRVGCVARLSRDKGVDLLLEAVAKLPDAHLTILGDGPEEDTLRRLAKDLGIEQRVTFQRETSNITDFYYSQDVLVLPSREHDPFGLCAAEAMACALPVIVTKCCGIAHLIRPGEGLVISSENVPALILALEQLRDPVMRAIMGRRARNRAELSLSERNMIQRYEEVLLSTKVMVEPMYNIISST